MASDIQRSERAIGMIARNHIGIRFLPLNTGRRGNVDGLLRKPCRHQCHRVNYSIAAVENVGSNSENENQSISWQVLPLLNQTSNKLSI